MVYKHVVVASFRIFAQKCEDAIAAKSGGWRLHSIVMEITLSWKNHGIVFLNFCGNPVLTKGLGLVEKRQRIPVDYWWSQT